MAFQQRPTFLPRLVSWVKRRANVLVFVLVAAVLAAFLPYVIHKADLANASENGKIFAIYDDPDYQIPAVNMLHGLGYLNSLNLPFDTYHLELRGGFWTGTLTQRAAHPETVSYSLFRAPGFPVLLTVTYALFGNDPLSARRMLGVLAWGIAVLLLLIGAYTAGWIGSLAGGLVGLYTIRYQPTLSAFTRVMSEIPAAFWLMLLMLFLVVYIRRKNLIALVASAITLVILIFTRATFAVALPMILIYLWFLRHSLKRIGLFTVIVMLSLAAWSMYASSKANSLVLLTTEGGTDFPEYNNIDVLQGNYSAAGTWNPGLMLKPDGTVDFDYHNLVPDGENGWLLGLTFWQQHIFQLPELFYVKLKAGFWYDLGRSENPFQLERLHLFGIGVLLFALGFRLPRRKTILHWLSPGQTLIIQLGLLSLLLTASNRIGFYVILLVWGAILLLAVLRPYGHVYSFKVPELHVYLIVVVAQACLLMLFGADGINRFQHPLDPLLLLCALLGLWFIVKGIIGQLYKAIHTIRTTSAVSWAIVAVFAALNVALIGAIYYFPAHGTERWMINNIPRNARLVADNTVINDIFGATRRQGWQWNIRMVSLAQNDPDIVPGQNTYLFLDERLPYGPPFKTRVQTLIDRGAVLLYHSDNPLGIGLQQAILLEPAR